jgi:hypothetical protein
MNITTELITIIESYTKLIEAFLKLEQEKRS